jgi:hypothetical protein
MYSFKVIPSDDERRGISGKLVNPWVRYQIDPGFKLSEYMARFRGAVGACFGDPEHTSSLADEAFSYFIEATDEQGNVWILNVYEGASGPAIGGDRRVEGIFDAAEALIDLIEATPPVDYEAVVYDDDTDWTIRYGCKDGDCYYEELKGDRRK